MYFLVLFSPCMVLVLFLLFTNTLLAGLWIPAVLSILIAVYINWKVEAFPLGLNHPNYRVDGITTIKVLTYNLNRAYSTSINKGLEHDVISLILSQTPDIVLLQEFNPKIYSSITKGLSAVYPFGDINDNGSQFKSVFSRYPIEDYIQLESSEASLPICSMTVNIDGHFIRVVNCHLMSNNYSVVYKELRKQKRSLLLNLKAVVNSIMTGYRIRNVQVDSLLAYLRHKDEPVVICGDFNDVGGSSVLQKLEKAGFHDVWWKKGRGFGFTFHGMGMRLRLDHCLYDSKSLRPLMTKVINSNLSDHRPLVASFIIK